MNGRQVMNSDLQQLLSVVYFQECNCRKLFPELDDILDIKFHLADMEQVSVFAPALEGCPYRKKLEEAGIVFEDYDYGE